MKYRIWSNQSLTWLNTVHLTGGEIFSGTGTFSFALSGGDFILQRMSDSLKGSKGERLGEGDIVEVATESGTPNIFIVRYGSVRRKMDTGAVVDIECFYFALHDPQSWHHGKPYFQMARNWQGGHDASITKVIGNTIYSPIEPVKLELKTEIDKEPEL